MPATTGGSTSGSRTRDRTTPWPRNWVRARTSAIGTPRTTHSTVAINDVRRLRANAVNADCDVSSDGNWVQSTRVSIAASGSTMNSDPSAAGMNNHPGASRRGAVAAMFRASRIRRR